MNNNKFKEFQKLGKKLGEKIGDEQKKGISFKLTQMMKSDNREDIIHILSHIIIANQVAFPRDFAEIVDKDIIKIDELNYRLGGFLEKFNNTKTSKEMKKAENVRTLTFTILTESSVPLSFDQKIGNYTPIKTGFRKDGQHAITSVETITYEMRRQLFDKGWKQSEKEGLEADIFGFSIACKQLSKTSPLRIIPFESVHLCEANEEIFGDYYVYTITIELDRFGVMEVDVKNGKYLAPEDRKYMSKEIREQALKDVVDVITEFTRNIRHQKIHLKPLAVFGGAFRNVIPYFWNDVELDEDNKLVLDHVADTIESYELSKDNYIVGVSEKLDVIIDDDNDIEISKLPVKEMKSITKKLKVKEDNKWYLEEESTDEDTL